MSFFAEKLEKNKLVLLEELLLSLLLPADVILFDWLPLFPLPSFTMFNTSPKPFNAELTWVLVLLCIFDDLLWLFCAIFPL